MQAVVLAVKDKKASVLEKGGGMRIIEDLGYVPGQILELPETAEFVKTEKKPPQKAKPHRPHWNMARQAAAVLVVLLGTGIVAANGAPVSVMTMDVNPSLKYTVNPFDRVIGLDAYNGDGEELMEGLLENVRGKKIDVALDLTLDALREAAYLEGEDTTLIITVSSQFAGNADRIKSQVLSRAESWNEHQDASSSISMDVVEVEQDVMADAAAKGVSPGKLYITRQLNAAISEDEEFDEEEWLNKSVADIEAATKAGTTKQAPVQNTAVTPDITDAVPAVIESTQKAPVVQTQEIPVVQPVAETPVEETSSESASFGSDGNGSKQSSKKQPKVSSEAAVADEPEEAAPVEEEASAGEGEGSASGQETTGGSQESQSSQNPQGSQSSQDSSGTSEGHEESGSGTEQQTTPQPAVPAENPSADPAAQGGTEGGGTEQTQEGSSDTSQPEAGSTAQESSSGTSEGSSGDGSSGGGSESSAAEAGSSEGSSDSSAGSSESASCGSSEDSSAGSESSAPQED